MLVKMKIKKKKKRKKTMMENVMQAERGWELQ